MENYTITFLQPRELSTMRNAFEISFSYLLIEDKYIGTPEEKNRTYENNIKVGITSRMNGSWRAKDKDIDLLKILCDYGKRFIIQKLKNHTLQENEELIISSATHTDEYLFELNKIIVPGGNQIKIETPDKTIMKTK